MATAKSRAVAVTASGAKYMTQLAKHWSHKFEVDLGPDQARIMLPSGIASMAATPQALEVTVEVQDPETLARMEEVVERHLLRFSFREPDLKLDWKREA